MQEDSYEVIGMLPLLKKTEYLEFDHYKTIIDRMDEVYFMNHIAKKKMNI